MLIYGIGFLYMGRVFVYKMECLYTGWSVSIRDGMLVYGLGGSKRNGVLIYRMSC